MRSASGHQCKVKMSRSEKKVKKKTYDTPSIKALHDLVFCLGKL